MSKLDRLIFDAMNFAERHHESLANKQGSGISESAALLSHCERLNRGNKAALLSPEKPALDEAIKRLKLDAHDVRCIETSVPGTVAYCDVEDVMFVSARQLLHLFDVITKVEPEAMRKIVRTLKQHPQPAGW